MLAKDYVRVKPGPPIAGISYDHVEVYDPTEDDWHCVRAAQDRADAIDVQDYIVKAIAHAQGSNGKR